MGEHPSSIGRYEILAPLGKGGMAEVFVGRTTGEGGFERLVAVKRILPELAETADFVAMFTDEARISAELSHSNIGQVYEFGKEQDSYFIAMEYIQGVHLRRLYRLFGKLKKIPPPGMAAYVMTNVCAALEHAHTRCDKEGRSLNIIHRDVSPSNVLVTFEGEIKLIDFGIARARERVHETSASSLKGKFAYMSPEQAYGRELDQRSDIFGAGILLFEMLTRRNPFEDENDLSTLERVREARVVPPRRVVAEVPAELERICLKALQRDPAERYASAAQMQAELEAFHFKVGYGRRQLARLMGKAFSRQRDQTRALLRQQVTGSTDAGTAGSSPAARSSLPRLVLQLAAVLAVVSVVAVVGDKVLDWIYPDSTAETSAPPSLTKRPAAKPLPAEAASARRVASLAPRQHRVTVQTEVPAARCTAARDGGPVQQVPCSLSAPAGQQIKLEVFSGQQRLFSETWTVDADRVIKLDLVQPRPARAPGVKRGVRKPRHPPKRPPRKPAAGPSTAEPDPDDKEVEW